MNRFWLTVLLPVVFVVTVIWCIKYVWAIIFDPEHALHLLKSVDKLANAVANGDINNTISKRAGLAIRDDDKRNTWWACPLCYVLDKIDNNHCANSSKIPG